MNKTILPISHIFQKARGFGNPFAHSQELAHIINIIRMIEDTPIPTLNEIYQQEFELKLTMILKHDRI
jgi:hypothetical protein